MKLNLLSATELIKKIKSKKVSVEEACRDCLEAVSEKDPVVKAWEYIDPESAIRHAKRLDKKKELGSLAGVPVGVKDIFNTSDMPTAMGSPLWKGFTPGNDARVVHSIRMQDGLVLGKTVSAEFAVHYLPKNKTVNPHDPRYSPGTSSSGSAAAVASYMVPLALGTQTAGSIIRPASYCGVYGFKPTFGTVPRTAMLKTTDSLDTVGLLARTVDDVKLLFDVIRVRGSNYPFVNATLDRNSPIRLSRKIKVGFISGGIHVFNKFEKYAMDAFDSYIRGLKGKGQVELVKIKPSADFNKIHDIHSTIYDKTLSYYFKDEFKQHTLISELMYEIIERGNRITGAEYADALGEQVRIGARIGKELAGYDAVLTLSTSGEPPLIDEREKPDTCLIWTFLGYPVLNIPAFTGPNGLPFGLQVAAKKYDDYKMLHIAKYFLANKDGRAAG
ncbi:MAG: amidase [Candidatus Omnitrophica bacterium]|nr:amidase [Candidatus Omnitrophota bacterium]MDD5310587.1 amidase [Candidatus Omnitrophota bacterium]MDD5545987.1 amidase [Candidatus Omnitrophota bacterium]